MSPTNRSTLFFGLALLIVGVLLLLNNIGLIPPEVGRLWPVLLIGIGAWVFGSALVRRRGGGLMGGVILLTAGIFLLLQNFELVRASALGPVMLMAVGAGLLLRGFVRPA
jgi:hypothetical protein